MSWATTHEAKWHKMQLKQRQAVGLIYNENKFSHTYPLM